MPPARIPANGWVAPARGPGSCLAAGKRDGALIFATCEMTAASPAHPARTSLRVASSSAVALTAAGVLALGATLSTPVAAQPAPADLILAQAPTARALPQITVTATRQESRLDEQVAHVTVIERDEIERSSGHSLAEILATQAGVQMIANGGPASSSSLFLRGTESRHVLLLVDGVRYGSATSGRPELSGIPLDQIERIEIVRGPMSSLYGSDAVGGVIQVFTRRGQPGFRPHASAVIGSKRFGSLAAGVSGGDERWDYAVTAQHHRNSGFSATNEHVPFDRYHPDNDGFRQSSIAANIGWKFLPDWQARLTLLQSGGRVETDDGVPLDDPGIDSQAKIRAQVMGFALEGKATGIWRTTLRASRSEDRYDTIRSSSEFDLGLFRTVQVQYGWENRLALPWANVVFGLERLEQSVSKPPPQYDVTERSINAAFIGFDRSRDRHHLQASARHDRNSQYGSKTTGAIGYGYDLTSHWRLGGSLGTSFVAPTFNQLYFPNFGNPDLKPEEGKQGEVFIRYARPGHEVRLARYQNRIRGYIASGQGQASNVPRSRIDGWELAWTGHHGPWAARLSADWLDPRNTVTGTQLQRRARRHATAALDRDLGDWRVGAAMRAVGDRFENAANTNRLGGFALFDLYADWRANADWSLGVRMNNLGDRRYETAYGYNQPGRELYLTARYTPR